MALSSMDIRRVVDNFYLKVRSDQLLGPIFDQAISDSGWPQHLERMHRFWSMMLLKEGDYDGRPMPVHIQQAQKTPMTEEHFDRWLDLFAQTVQETVPAATDDFMKVAERIAHSLQQGISFYQKSLAQAE